MQDWKKTFVKYITQVEEHFDDLTLRLRKRMNYFHPIQIVPYRSYGTVNRLYIKGRVLENKGIQAGADKDTILNNLLNMYKRFESDEVINARLQINFQGEMHSVVTDNEGYFVFNLEPHTPLHLDDIWHDVNVELLDAPIPHTPGIQATAPVLVPPPDAEYGIISDIDDTIIHTSAYSALAMSRTVFLNNARTRLPFAGVSEFYKSLQLGRNGKRNNPFFYVSSSPWNMYDLLHDFLDMNQIPAGPLLLRDFGLLQNKFFGSGHMGHKYKEIQNILLTYPDLNFVLIGDSGQEDANIYREVVKNFPNRILAIYIRDVQLPEREKIAVAVSEELKGHQVPMLIVDNTVEAAEHAAQTGLIFREAIPAIENDKEKDKGTISGKDPVEVYQ
jgi:phosphatidate phosphatase APP1